MRLSLPLTPALPISEGERENRRQADGESSLVETFVSRTLLFPLPIRWGEGQGEGIFLRNSGRRLTFFCAFMFAAFSLIASPVKIELPAETGVFKPAPGAELANGQCLVCHSVEYVVMQ